MLDVYLFSSRQQASWWWRPAPYRTTSYPISQQLHRTGSIVANSTASVTDSIVFYQYFIVCMLPAKLWVRTRLCPRPGHVLWMPPVTDDPCIIQICHQIRHDIVVIQTSRMGYTHCRHDSGDAVCGDMYYRWQCGDNVVSQPVTVYDDTACDTVV